MGNGRRRKEQTHSPYKHVAFYEMWHLDPGVLRLGRVGRFYLPGSRGATFWGLEETHAREKILSE
jgi:hypothetical protein